MIQTKEVNRDVVNQIGRHVDVSSKYQSVKTSKLLDFFAGRGWQVRQYQEQGALVDKNKGFQKHLISLYNPDVTFKTAGMDSRPEINILNSHNKRSGLSIQFGLFRMVCLNGLWVNDGMFETVNVRHVGDIYPKIDAGIDRIVASVDKLESKVLELSARQLTMLEQLEFTEKLVDLRLAGVSGQVVDVNVSDLITCRRPEDSGTDIWTVYNRLQENILRYGFKYKVKRTTKPIFVDGVCQAFGGTKIVNATARPVKSIDATAKLNKAFFETACNYL